MYKKIADAVERARQVADLENSNYISDNEIYYLLNEAYDSVYADLININDRYFIKSTEFNGTTYTLPEDFMLLAGLWTKTNVPVPKRVHTQAPTSGSNWGIYYDLLKDHISIQGTYVGPFKIEYYPVLEPITWPLTTGHEDDTIDIPNNICFTYFCYVMAMKMKMKQGADFLQIQAMADHEFKEYIQLQHRDNFGVTRIGNMYGYGGEW